jgi:hypothetical protein
MGNLWFTIRGSISDPITKKSVVPLFQQDYETICL